MPLTILPNHMNDIWWCLRMGAQNMSPGGAWWDISSLCTRVLTIFSKVSSCEWFTQLWLVSINWGLHQLIFILPPIYFAYDCCLCTLTSLWWLSHCFILQWLCWKNWREEKISKLTCNSCVVWQILNKISMLPTICIGDADHKLDFPSYQVESALNGSVNKHISDWNAHLMVLVIDLF